MASIIRGEDNFNSSAAGGGFRFISSTDLASDATADFTGFNASLYDSYQFVFLNVSPSRDGTVPAMRTSTDGGATYNSTLGDYTWAQSSHGNAQESYSAGLGPAQIYLTVGQIGNNTGEEGMSGVVQVFGPHLARRTNIITDFGYVSSTAKTTRTNGSAIVASSAAFNAVRFYFIAGVMASGTITMYGKMNS